MKLRGFFLVFYLALALAFGPTVASAAMVSQVETRVAASELLTTDPAQGHLVLESAPLPEFRLSLRLEGVGESCFIDGPNRYRALRNNPLRFIDPDGRNPVAALIAWLGTLTLEQQATFGALSLASLYFVGQQATTAPSGPFTIPDLPPITGPFQPPVHEAPVGPYSPPTIGPAVGPYIPPSYESPVGSFTVPQGLGFTCLFQTDVEQAAEIMKGLGHLLEIDDACVHCAKVLEQELEARGIDAQVIDLNAVTFVPDVYDVKTGKRVSTGRLHRGVRVGDTVFDNAYPEGLPYNEWVNRFISGGRPLRPTPK